MITISAGNQKGGTAKTSTIFALGEILAGAYKKRVLMVDLDPQGSLTKATAVKPSLTIADVFNGADIADAILPVSENLWILPSSMALTEVNLDNAEELKEILDPIKEAGDYTLIDLPPALNFFTSNGLAASDYVIIPARPTKLDVSGIGLFLDVVKQVQSINPSLKVAGVILTFFDPRIVSMREVIKSLKNYDLKIFKSMIGQSIRVAESTEGKSVVTAFPSNPRAREYVLFVEELMKEIQ